MSRSPHTHAALLVAAALGVLLAVGAVTAPLAGQWATTSDAGGTALETGTVLGADAGPGTDSGPTMAARTAMARPVAATQERTPDETTNGTPDGATDGTPDGSSDASANVSSNTSTAVSEERYVERVPEPGDEYFEAKAEDGSWVSYDNPRDRYRDPMVGNASGKVCVTLRNEAGEVVAGESVSNTTVTIPTPSLYWHSYADPMVVEFPLTEHYERPLDSDQFGTSPDLPQGDGFLDSHCIEYHGPPDNKTIEYGQPVIEGQHADNIEVVGYVQQVHEAWDTDVDPMADAVPYEETGGNWTMRTGASHGQVVIVLQLDGIEGDRAVRTDEAEGGVPGTETATETSTPELTEAVTATSAQELQQNADVEESPTGLDQTAPGSGVVGVALLVSLVVLLRRREG